MVVQKASSTRVGSGESVVMVVVVNDRGRETGDARTDDDVLLVCPSVHYTEFNAVGRLHG